MLNRSLFFFLLLKKEIRTRNCDIKPRTHFAYIRPNSSHPTYRQTWLSRLWTRVFSPYHVGYFLWLFLYGGSNPEHLTLGLVIEWWAISKIVFHIVDAKWMANDLYLNVSNDCYVSSKIDDIKLLKATLIHKEQLSQQILVNVLLSCSSTGSYINFLISLSNE